MNSNQEQLCQLEQFGPSPLEKIFDLFLLLNELKIYNALYFEQEKEDIRKDERMNSYELAKKHRMLSIEEIDLLKSCVARLPANPKIINIGASEVGTSACAMLEANPNAFIFSLDKNPCPGERENLIKCGLPANQVLRVLGDSTKIDTKFWPFMVDMTFIDGGHTIEEVMADCENWKPFTRQFILFHDYQHPNYVKDGINQFDDIVNELMKDWKRMGQARYLVTFEKE